MTQPETTAVATRPSDKLSTALTPVVENIFGMTRNREYAQRAFQATMLAALNNPELYDCTPASMTTAVLRIAQWGLDVGVTAHIVPFNVNVAPKGQPKRWEKRAQAIADYRGLIQLALDGHIIRACRPPRVVYEGDFFEYSYGLNEELKHRPCPASRRGAIIGAYVVTVMPFHAQTFTYLPIEDIELRRAKSKQWGPDQVKMCPDWYAMKAVVRAHFDKMPKKSPRLAMALTEDASEGEASEIADAEVVAIGPSTEGGAPALTGEVSEARPRMTLGEAEDFTVGKDQERLADLPDRRVSSVLEWAKENGRDRLVLACEIVLADRNDQAESRTNTAFEAKRGDAEDIAA